MSRKWLSKLPVHFSLQTLGQNRKLEHHIYLLLKYNNLYVLAFCTVLITVTDTQDERFISWVDLYAIILYDAGPTHSFYMRIKKMWYCTVIDHWRALISAG